MMLPEILKKIKAISFVTRRMMNSNLVGAHATKQKGFGFEFDQIRTYNYGDDVRMMDWSSSARTGTLMVRQYIDEKNRTILVCLDVSASTKFASHQGQFCDVMQQVTAILVAMCYQEQDNVGLLLFSDSIELFIPPSRGYKHIMHLIQAMFTHRPRSTKTDMTVLFTYLMESFTKPAAIVVVSDFIASDFSQALQYVNCKRELIFIRCLDQFLLDLPEIGYVWGQDTETGVVALLNLSSKEKLQLQDQLHSRILDQNRLWNNYAISYLDIHKNQDVVHDLIVFFKQRKVD